MKTRQSRWSSEIHIHPHLFLGPICDPTLAFHHRLQQNKAMFFVSSLFYIYIRIYIYRLIWPILLHGQDGTAV